MTKILCKLVPKLASLKSLLFSNWRQKASQHHTCRASLTPPGNLYPGKHTSPLICARCASLFGPLDPSLVSRFLDRYSSADSSPFRLLRATRYRGTVGENQEEPPLRYSTYLVLHTFNQPHPNRSRLGLREHVRQIVLRLDMIHLDHIASTPLAHIVVANRV